MMEKMDFLVLWMLRCTFDAILLFFIYFLTSNKRTEEEEGEIFLLNATMTLKGCEKGKKK